MHKLCDFAVTPCVGVWIEIILSGNIGGTIGVTPCVGVWIEIENGSCNDPIGVVTPCVGVWIEIWIQCG